MFTSTCQVTSLLLLIISSAQLYYEFADCLFQLYGFSNVLFQAFRVLSLFSPQMCLHSEKTTLSGETLQKISNNTLFYETLNRRHLPTRSHTKLESCLVRKSSKSSTLGKVLSLAFCPSIATVAQSDTQNWREKKTRV